MFNYQSKLDQQYYKNESYRLCKRCVIFCTKKCDLNPNNVVCEKHVVRAHCKEIMNLFFISIFYSSSRFNFIINIGVEYLQDYGIETLKHISSFYFIILKTMVPRGYASASNFEFTIAVHFHVR